MTKEDNGGSGPTTPEGSVPNPPSAPGSDPTPATPPRTYLIGDQRLRALPAAELFPLMDAKGREELTTNLKSRGQLEPVYIDATKTYLVDGRNRCDSCEAAHIPVRFETLSPDTDLISFVTSKNLHPAAPHNLAAGDGRGRSRQSAEGRGCWEAESTAVARSWRTEHRGDFCPDDRR